MDKSLLHNYTRQDVIEFLGSPDFENESFIRYSLGAEYSDTLDQELSKGWPKPSRSLKIYFTDENELVDRLRITGQ